MGCPSAACVYGILIALVLLKDVPSEGGEQKGSRRGAEGEHKGSRRGAEGKGSEGPDPASEEAPSLLKQTIATKQLVFTVIY